ncbi:MAG: OmpA family protein [Candidatus Eisenbacteria bacterium]
MKYLSAARSPRRNSVASYLGAFALAAAIVQAGCAGSSARTKKRSLAEELSGDNRTVTENARGLIVSLPDILFDFDKATLRPEVESTLNQVAQVLLQYPTIHIQVEGHTDDVGSDSYNQTLSEKRATAVYDFLSEAGIDPEQMTHQGFGESRPVVPNDTAEGRQHNRRVDLIIPDPPEETGSAAQP